MSSSDDHSPQQEKKEMSSSDDPSPPQKKQKDFFVSYYDRETYYRKFNDHSILDDEKGVMSDSDSDFTEEEEKIYRDAIKASDVFFFFFAFLHLFHSHILQFHNIYSFLFLWVLIEGV